MARVEPFRALRPVRGLAEKVAAPPYDVLDSEEARVYAQGNPHCFLHITKPEIDLPAEVDLYSDEVYAQARKNLDRFVQEGTLVQDETSCYYLYRQVWGDHVQTGLVAGASAQDYLDDVIRKHELTREDKEQDRMRHIDTLNANTGPVFLAFRHNDRIQALFDRGLAAAPEYQFKTSDGIEHIFWVVSDQELVAEIRQAFQAVDILYVADGHHRSASATRIKVEREKANAHHTGDEEYNFFLSVIFPDNQLKILPYNRVVRDLNGMTPEAFLGKLEEKFEIVRTELQAPPRTGQVCLYLEKTWYLLTARPGTYDANDPIASLDVAILQSNVLSPMLGIDNPRKDKRIDFVGGIRGTGELVKLVDSGKFALAFSMHPTTMDQLISVADAGKIMPPKSTWFEPKLRSGLAVHLLD